MRASMVFAHIFSGHVILHFKHGTGIEVEEKDCVRKCFDVQCLALSFESQHDGTSLVASTKKEKEGT